MLDRIFKRDQLSNVLGAATIVALVSAISAHPQNVSPSDTSSSGAMQSRQDKSGSMNQGNQSGAYNSGTSSSGTGAANARSNFASNTAGNATSNTAAGTASNADRRLMRELAYANLAEIDTAKIAQSKTSNDQVRTFAQHMIDDHTKALNDLQQLAQNKGVQLPTTPDAKHQAMAKKLNALSGDAFDKQYTAQAGVSDHRKTERLVSRISRQARDPDLKALAGNLLPGIEQHLQMAQQMHGGKASGQGSSGAGNSKGSSSSSGSDQDTTGASGRSGTRGGTSGTGGSNSRTTGGASGS